MELLNRTPTPERCLGRHQTVNAMEKRQYDRPITKQIKITDYVT